MLMSEETDQSKEEIFYETNKIRKQKWLYELEWFKFYNWEYTRPNSKLYDKNVIDDIHKAVKNLLNLNYNTNELQNKLWK